MWPHASTLIACLLILASVALLLMSNVVRPRSRLAIVGVIGSILASVGVVAFFSYFTGVSDAFVSGHFSRIAVHTAAAIAATGIAVIRFAWRDSLATDIGTPAWLPLLASAGTLATAFCLYAAMLSHEQSSFAQQVSFESEGLRQFLRVELDNRIQPLIRLARRRAVSSNAPKEEWDSDTQSILSRGGYQAIAWLDASAKAIWTTPPGAGDAMPDGNAAFEERRKTAFDAARERRALAGSRPVDLVTGGKGAIVVVPVFVQDQLAGYVAGVFRYELLFQNLLASNPSPRYALAVYDRGERIFLQGAPSRSAGLLQKLELPVGSAKWQLQISPTEALVLQSDSPAGGALLVGGSLLAVLFGLLIRLAQMARVRPSLEHTLAPTTASGFPAADIAHLPVVTYNCEGAPIAWNDAARMVLCGAPPRISPSPDGFRLLNVTLLRASASPVGSESLRTLLESCSLPTLLFDAQGGFVAANASASRTAGWTESVWNGRKVGSLGGQDPLEIQTVLLLQGQWATPA